MASHFNNADRLEAAHTIALQALTFLVAEPRQLEMFLGETGLTPAQLREDAQSAQVLEGALSVLVNDEPLLLTFAANNSLAPEAIVEAHQILATDDGRLRPLSSI